MYYSYAEEPTKFDKPQCRNNKERRHRTIMITIAIITCVVISQAELLRVSTIIIKSTFNLLVTLILLSSQRNVRKYPFTRSGAVMRLIEVKGKRRSTRVTSFTISHRMSRLY